MRKRLYNHSSLFGPFWAYLVVISPPLEIKKQIADIKKTLNDIYPLNPQNLHSIAHITLTESRTDDENFPEVIQNLLNGKKPFIIEIKGWDYFDHGNTVSIFLKVSFPEPIVDLMKAVKSKSKTPHLSLAKNVSHETLEKLTPHLEKLHYFPKWLCDEVTVLRKKMSEKHLGFRDSFKIPLKD